jgi:hypothetical protein
LLCLYCDCFGGGSLVDFFLALALRHYCTTDYGESFICSSFLYRKLKRYHPNGALLHQLVLQWILIFHFLFRALQSTGNVAVVPPNLDMTAGTDQGILLDFTNVLMPVFDGDHWILFVIHTANVSG